MSGMPHTEVSVPSSEEKIQEGFHTSVVPNPVVPLQSIKIKQNGRRIKNKSSKRYSMKIKKKNKRICICSP